MSTGDQTLTRQQIYDTVVTHLWKQKKQSKAYVRGLHICAYRSSDGCKCAVGALIPDDKYTVAMEAKAFDNNFIEMFKLQQVFPSDETSVALIRFLQRSHDELIIWASKDNFVSVFRICAQAFGLYSNILTDIADDPYHY